MCVNRKGGEEKKSPQCLALYVFTLPVLICVHPQGNQRNTHIGLYDLHTKQNEVRVTPGFSLVKTVL